MKIFGARKSSDWANKGAKCACVHLFSVVGIRHPVHLRLRKGWFISDRSILLGLRVAPSKPDRARRRATMKVIFETVSEEASSEEPKNAAPKSCWIALLAVALSLSAVLGGQPAYAEFRTNVLAEVGVQREVVIDSASSVEAILAKQLARRFREMTDEELVDILRQLLKASRPSLSSQNAVDDGIFPEDLVLQNEKRQIETKAAERTGAEKIHAAEEIDTKSNTEVKDNNTVSEQRNFQGLKETREKDGGELNLLQAETKNVQADERRTQKLSEEANNQEKRGDNLSIEKGKDGKNTSDPQERLRGGSSASIVPPTTEKSDGDGSVGSKSDSSDTGGKRAADQNAREGSREDEDLTELLWAEWSRRVGGQVVEQPQRSSASFSLAEFGQDVIKKVAAFTALEKAIGLFTIWSAFMILAYRLGRARASPRKEAPVDKIGNRDLPIVSSGGRARGDMDIGPATLSGGFDFFQDSFNSRISGLKEFASKGKRVSNASKREDDDDARVSPGEGQSSRKSDPPENGKWWRTPLGDDLLSESRTPSVRNQGNNQISSYLVPGGSRQDLDDHQRIGTRRGLTRPVESGSDANDPINSGMKQLLVHHGREETSRVSWNSVDSNNTEPQAAAAAQPRQRGSQSPWQAEWNNPDVRETGERRDQEDLNTRDGSYMSPIVESLKGKNLDYRRATSPRDDLQTAETTDTGRMTSSGQIMNSQQPVDGDWMKESSGKVDSYEQVKQKDSLAGVNVTQGAREVEGSVASQSEANLNTFVHDHFLWVRDDDGIFIRQAAVMEEGGGSRFTSFVRGDQDMPDSTRSFDAEGNGRKVAGSNLPSSTGPIEQRTGPERGFDYRQLVIDSKDEYPPTDQDELAREKEPDTLRPQIRPLRYGSGRQKVP